jgi:hypothetical protein
MHPLISESTGALPGTLDAKDINARCLTVVGTANLLLSLIV